MHPSRRRQTFDEQMESELSRLQELGEDLPELPYRLQEDFEEAKNRYLDARRELMSVKSPEFQKSIVREGNRIVGDVDVLFAQRSREKEELQTEILRLITRMNGLLARRDEERDSESVRFHRQVTREIADLDAEITRQKVEVQRYEENTATLARSIEFLDADMLEQRKRLASVEAELERLKKGNMSFEDSEAIQSLVGQMRAQIEGVYEILKYLEASLSCHKCGELFENPYTLRHCGHTYCAKCLHIEPMTDDNEAASKSLQFIIDYLVQNRARLMDCFAEMDRNGDGLLTYTEFIMGFNSLGVRAEDGVLDRIWNFADINESRTLEYAEFFALLSSARRALMAEPRSLGPRFPAVIIDGSKTVFCQKCVQEVQMKVVFNYSLNAIASKWDFLRSHRIDLMRELDVLEEDLIAARTREGSAPAPL